MSNFDISGAVVLLVDDDQFLRSMYVKKFEARGAHVETAGTAEEALGKLRAGLKPAIITFDIVMPGIDGCGFLETLKKENLAQDVVKVALSNQSSSEEMRRVTDLGAVGHITKANSTPSEIVDKVVELASNR
ncbi:MAG: response regulator [Minisyncoccia bacterium]